MERKQAYFILIVTFVVVLAWVIFSILGNAINSTISDSLNVQISPINPTFDMQTINELKKREIVIPNIEDSVSTASSIISPTAQPEGTISALPNQQTP